MSPTTRRATRAETLDAYERLWSQTTAAGVFVFLGPTPGLVHGQLGAYSPMDRWIRISRDRPPGSVPNPALDDLTYDGEELETGELLAEFITLCHERGHADFHEQYRLKCFVRSPITESGEARVILARATECMSRVLAEAIIRDEEAAWQVGRGHMSRLLSSELLEFNARESSGLGTYRRLLSRWLPVVEP